ncbi:hypothetical protein WJX74_000518 [Apatococcus lobatus]|uniref:NADH:ubiquinone oxidoreductase intermediate-associated protein 30 domain-containing protein n=1 Tax=Apatococcus lobatus TaxID=904363 RepID=A0AAW1RFZ1_9CHLO
MFKRLAQEGSRYLQQVRHLQPPSEQLLYRFASAPDLDRWRVFTDSEWGGSSTATLAHATADTAVLSGQISRELQDPEAKGRLIRSGLCGLVCKEPPDAEDLDAFDQLVVRIKSDGRKYIVNVREDNWVVGDQSHDIWQSFLFGRPGEWQEVVLPFSRFLLTWKGKLVETKSRMSPQRITSIGIALAGGDALQPQGPFSLGLDWGALHRASLANKVQELSGTLTAYLFTKQSGGALLGQRGAYCSKYRSSSDEMRNLWQWAN